MPKSVMHKRFLTTGFLSRLSLSLLVPGLVLSIVPAIVRADGFVIDKIYHPYVNPLERELELRALVVQDEDEVIDGSQLYRLGLARAFGERVRGEFYLIGSNTPASNLALAAYELELKWQLTEQGEYFADWGLLFELEAERGEDIQEFRSSVLMEKELGQWATTLNLSAVYEWGDDIRNEWESQLAAQLRYRYAVKFEPAVEFYSGQDVMGLGPVALGQVRFGKGRKLRWELGVIFGVDSTSPDQVWRAMLEYEF
jgi:hypothetical protein